MTMQRECRNGPFVVQCNTCLDTEELQGEDFPEAVADSKARGFTAFKVGDRKWIHECGYCTKVAKQQQAKAA